MPMFGIAAGKTPLNRWTLHTLGQICNPAAATTGRFVHGISRAMSPNLWSLLGGKWAFCTRRTGRPNGLLGKIPKIKPIAKEFAGFGSRDRMLWRQFQDVCDISR